MLPSARAKLLWGGVPRNLKEAAMMANTPEKRAFCLSLVYTYFEGIYKTHSLGSKWHERMRWYDERSDARKRIQAFFPPLNHREQA